MKLFRFPGYLLPLAAVFYLLKALLTLTIWVARLTGRYVSGRPMDGKLRTDASHHWFRKGTKVFTPDGVVSPWWLRPGWQRSAWRLGVPSVAGATWWGHEHHPVATYATLGLTVGTGAVVGGRRAARAYRERTVRREYVVPLAATLAPVLKQPDDRPLSQWLHIPAEMVGVKQRGVLDAVAVPSWVRVPVPAVEAWEATKRLAAKSAKWWHQMRKAEVQSTNSGWIRYPYSLLVSPDLKKVVNETIAGKLGGDDWVIQWHAKGSDPFISIAPKPLPPEKVLFADVLSYFEKALPAAPLLGLSATGPVSLNLDTDAPHVAISCGPGAGKSIFIRAIIAHLLHHGVQVIVLDVKQTSQRWCKDLPGVRYCRTGEEMSEALLDVGEECGRRSGILDSVPGDSEDVPDVGPRIAVIFEEQNVGVQEISTYWAGIRTSKDPKRPPAFGAMDRILATGREMKVHMISVAQLFTVLAAGGNPMARGIYGPRVLARADRNAWLMLAPDAAPFPKQSKRRGRMHLYFDGDLTEFQVPLLSVKQARDWATSGAPVTVPVTWGGVSGLPRQSVTGPSVTGPRLYSLAEAAEDREAVVPLSYDALRQRKARSSTPFPKGTMVGKREKWTAEQLTDWLGAELAAAATEEPAGE